MSLIRLDNGGFRYPSAGRWVFRNLEFTLLAGEAVRLVGRNGSGKTTLLKALAGILTLTEGEVQRNPCTSASYMDQFAGEMLALDLTIAQQFKMATKPTGGLRPLLTDLLVQFDIGLQSRTDEFLGHLSGGQRQIVALLSTLAAGANVICLDEFTASMDEQSAAVASEMLQHTRTIKGVALILVNHGSIGIQVDREFNLSSDER